MIDVLIVGAGVSGLTLAWTLAQAGRQVEVVEARDRIGGRAHTVELAGFDYDLGASWVWGNELAARTLLDALGIERRPSLVEGDDLYDDGHQVQRGRLPRELVAQYRLLGGTGSITRALAERIGPVRLSRPARVIEPTTNGVRVHFDDGTIEARHVAFAGPPSLLGAGVELRGVASETLSDLSRVPVWMGEVAKVVAVYDAPFWRHAGLSGRVFSRRGPMNEVHDLTNPNDSRGGALFGFVHRANALDGWEEAVRAQLDRLFGSKAASPAAFHAMPWWGEEYTVPSNAPPADEQLFGHKMLREPLLSGRLHLASTETAGVSTGHLNGAIHRAGEVARLIIGR